MVNCSICGNSQKNSLVLAKEMFLGTREVFPYTLCSACKSLTIETVPPNLDELYASYPGLKNSQKRLSFLDKLILRYVVTNSNPLSLKIGGWLNSFNDLRLKALYGCKLNPESSILDVGCGSGSFVFQLHELGFKKAVGIDPALQEDILLKNGGKLYKKTLYNMEGHFDFISYHHSFEHLENPVAVLKKTASLLTKNGICLIRLPNVESWAFRFFKENWSGIHPPYHLFLPSRKGMEILCQASGFKITDTRWEQLVESLLRSFCYSMDFASHDEFGTRTLLEDRPLGNRKIPFFTDQELNFWKAKSQQLLRDKLSDYTSFYLSPVTNEN